jgi:hypothetical protein
MEQGRRMGTAWISGYPGLTATGSHPPWPMGPSTRSGRPAGLLTSSPALTCSSGTRLCRGRPRQQHTMSVIPPLNLLGDSHQPHRGGYVVAIGPIDRPVLEGLQVNHPENS